LQGLVESGKRTSAQNGVGVSARRSCTSAFSRAKMLIFARSCCWRAQPNRQAPAQRMAFSVLAPAQGAWQALLMRLEMARVGC